MGNSIRKGASGENLTRVNRHDETERLPVLEHQGENLAEIDIFSGGDFLELRDLDNPASSSSSRNSSAGSTSSNECFDSIALLQDLEDPISEQNDACKKLNVSASNKSD
ncbi:uncharacterized protein LOC111314813 [Durio zibethinus]|uniref:Uncharacterized protein LOC111314813 n=1 Tax=Durio zibethinus TaxID=66656 RepID=A0A6P6B4R4_DURZI|nr:uncharacterized protein LOC111314813 [Durio zibethinus]XP_022772164.1 uncharacterized protein LOC111314813 [Durio zibethinus]